MSSLELSLELEDHRDLNEFYENYPFQDPDAFDARSVPAAWDAYIQNEGSD